MSSGISSPDSVTVVIPTFNRREFLADVVRALEAQTHELFEAVFVDDGSTDGTPEFLRSEFRGDERFSVVTTLNRGPSAARNTAALGVTSTWLAFTDDDCIPQPAWLAGLIDEAKRTGVSVVEGRTTTDPTVDMREQPWFTRGKEVASWTGIFQTCNLLVRTQDFLAIGGFDERFPTYGFGEDRDLGARLVDSGASGSFAADGLVHHRLMTMSYWAFLKRRYRWSHVVQLAALNPRARDVLRGEGDYLFQIPFVSQMMHLILWFGLAVGGVALWNGWWWVVPLGVVAYSLDRVRRTRREDRSVLVRMARAPLELVGLTVEASGFVVQSVRYRALLL